MLQKLKNRISQFRKKRSEERQYAWWLKVWTNVSLQDSINNKPRPEKRLLRIMGNGNSLKQVVDNMSNDCDYMVLNSYVLHDSYKILKPRYYVLADPGFFTGVSERTTLSLKKIFEETDWQMTLFVPWEHTKNIKLESTKFVQVEYVNQSNYVGPERYRHYLYEHNLAMPNVNNVLASAIYLAIYMGYKEVELYGVEHSWLRDVYVNDNNEVCLKDTHFYDKGVVKDMVFKSNDGGRNLKYHEVVKTYMEYFPAYWELRDLAEEHGCHILNMSPNSYIDAFERGVKNDDR